MLRLTISVAGVPTDYTQYVDWKGLRIREEANLPSQISFALTPSTKVFQVPPARAYVQVYSTKYARSVFTGFVVAHPERKFLGLSQVAPTSAQGQLYEYSVSCSSDEYLLNMKSVPFIPAFVNRTQGQILSDLAEVLCPGFFDTTMVASGDIVPYFEYSPQQSWTEVAKLFADGSRYRYKVRDRQIWYQPIGDLPLGIKYDETAGQGSFAPSDLSTAVLTVPLVNDLTVIGDTEAGNNREDYFLGDGFTGNFPLLHKVFRGASSLLLQESWNGQTLNTQQWTLRDPGNNFDFSAGALNLTDTLAFTFALGESCLFLKNGIELAGGINIQNGEFIWEDESEGVVGGIYTDTSFTNTALLAGFDITTPGAVTPSASGAGGISMQPFFSGAPVGPALESVPNHSYVLQMVIHAPQFTRYTRVYRTAEGEAFGGASSLLKGSITFVIQDYDIAAASGFFYQPEVRQVTVEDVELPAFAVYALLNNGKMNVSVTNTTLALMPLGGLVALEGPSGLFQPTGLILPMLPLGSGGFIGSVQPWPNQATGDILPEPLSLNAVPTVEVLGNGFDLQAAQITPGNSADTLAFYAQSLPAVGVPIRLQTWEAQAAVSRLQVSGSIQEEAFIVGDDGIRSAIITDLNPLPRTSEDCDNAALAFLKDRVGTFYDGRYVATSLFFRPLTSDVQLWPCVGRFFELNAPARGIAHKKMVVTKLDISVLDPTTELLVFGIGYGPDKSLEKVLKNFVNLRPPQVLTATDKAHPPDPRYVQNVTSSYLPDLQNVTVDINSITATSVTVSVKDFYFGPIEVRRIDTNWGKGVTPDLIGVFSGTGFSLVRQQYDQVWYMRPVLDGVTSRRSKVIRVRWPIKPSAPLYAGQTGPMLQFGFNGDMRNIYGIELRYYIDEATPLVLVQRPAVSIADLAVDILKTPLTTDTLAAMSSWTLLAYFFNQGWVYSDPVVVTADNPAGLGQILRIAYVPGDTA